jgi:LCP family protein required for cell wall assembly
MRRMDDVRKVPKPHYNHLHGHSGFSDIQRRDIEKASQKIQESYRVEETKNIPQQKIKKSFRKSLVLVPFTILVLLVGGYLGARLVTFASSVSTSREGFYKTLSNNIGAALGPVIPGLKNLDQTALASTIKSKKRLNILLLGYGGAGHDGAYLTDSMMVMSLNTENNQVSYIPIPRDLWVKIPTRGYDGSFSKINAAYPIGMDTTRYPNKLPQFSGVNGPGNLSKYEVSQVLGIPIDYYVSADFYAFKTIVDTLGGVEVNIENSFTDYTYPSGDANVNAAFCSSDNALDTQIKNCRYKKVHFEKGLQTMEGEAALEYARSRHALGPEGSDFARSKRQQKLLSAIEKKAISIGAISKIFTLMDAVQGHFKTDLSIAEVKDLADYVSTVDVSNAAHLSLTDQTLQLLVSSYSDDGQWILLPADTDYTEIHQYISDNLK